MFRVGTTTMDISEEARAKRAKIHFFKTLRRCRSLTRQHTVVNDRGQDDRDDEGTQRTPSWPMG